MSASRRFARARPWVVVAGATVGLALVVTASLTAASTYETTRADLRPPPVALPWDAFNQLVAEVDFDFPDGYSLEQEFAALEGAGGGRLVPYDAILEMWVAEQYRCAWLDAGLTGEASSDEMDQAMTTYWTLPSVAEYDKTGLDDALLDEVTLSLGFDSKYETLFQLSCASWWDA